MFTGIIESVGLVRAITPQGGDVRVPAGGDDGRGDLGPGRASRGLRGDRTGAGGSCTAGRNRYADCCGGVPVAGGPGSCGSRGCRSTRAAIAF